ncbi:MAG: NADP-dependent malic enzyme [Proteobacteria bacterium]|nr:NADP-dependent malic enzyme [Pseudomonadota bacterium]
MTKKSLDRAALEYHRAYPPGKLRIEPSKPVGTPRDLSLAYSPGVAAPCLEIAKNPDDAFEYTGRGNLVAVVTDGTAVLGLGNIGPLAGKPVMEGKAVLFKRFADIDVFDLEVDSAGTEDFIATVRSLAPTFGGINLEDIKAPECFTIEKRLQEELDIPVFHDDQHGTAIIAGAALYNALELVGKNLEEARIVMNGAGAAGIATAELIVAMGAKKANIILCDSKGVVFKGRTERMNQYKTSFASDTEARTLAEALTDADVFIGVSVAGVVSKDMLRAMASDPIVFALANPDPEITWPDAKDARDDVIMATGRSDYPNQVNNVLGFPFIFRGALDVRARKVNDAMKIAAVRALAQLAREEVPDSIRRAYKKPDMRFGREYLIPKPFDRRVLLWVAPAVAKAAVESGVARKDVTDWEQYQHRLERLLGRTHQIMRPLINRARLETKRIVFPEGSRPKILRAARNLAEDGVCTPVLLANARDVEYTLLKEGIELPDSVEIVNPDENDRRDAYQKLLWNMRKRKGLTPRDASAWLRNRNTFGMMMVKAGDADGIVTGLNYNYAEAVRPALQILGPREGVSTVSGLYVMVLKERLLFFADCTVNVNPTAEDLAEIAVNTAGVARAFDVEPKVAMLSFSNFGSTPTPESKRVKRAVEILAEREVDFEFDGEIQGDIAFNVALREEVFPFSNLRGEPNVLVFPDLQSGNIAYKLLTQLAGATAIGPLLVGMSHPVNVLQLGSDVSTIESMATITAVEAALGAY